MEKLYLFAIGGTGARVVRSLTMMLAAGIKGHYNAQNNNQMEKKTRSEVFMYEKDLPWEPAGENVTRQILGYDGQITMVKVKFEKGSVGTLHNTTILRFPM